MIYSQKQIYEYLLTNPLHVDVSVGDVEDLNGKDYIFFDYLTDELVGSDNRGIYRTGIQITVATKDYEDRKTLVEFVKNYLNVSISYEKSFEFEYFVARCNCTVLIHEE